MGGKASALSAVAGAEITFAYYAIAYKLDLSYRLYISALIFLTVILAAFILQKLRYALISRLLKKRHNERAVVNCNHKIRLTMDSALEIKLCLSLCNAYIRDGDYKKALDLLTDSSRSFTTKSAVRLFGISHSVKLEFYIRCIYLYVISNNLIKAQDCFDAGRRLFKNAGLSHKYNTEILRVFSMMEYAKGNYQTAQGLAVQGKSSTGNKKLTDEFEYIIAKCMVRTGREDDGAAILKRLMNKSSSSQVSQASRQFLIKVRETGK